MCVGGRRGGGWRGVCVSVSHIRSVLRSIAIAESTTTADLGFQRGSGFNAKERVYWGPLAGMGNSRPALSYND
jgi:hypothetical protein